MNMHILIAGLLIFLARICDVSLGTVRTIVTVQGRSILAFIFGFVEVTIWIAVVSTVVYSVKESPILIFFYALGFSTGNVVGIALERKLAFGLVVLKVMTREKGKQIADRLRGMGQPVTLFAGEGKEGPVFELYMVCQRRNLKQFFQVIREEDPNAFYITEQAREVSKGLRPIYQPVTGWRAIFKKK
ncbi:MAG: DUF2179 domain-containing protein [bacterium]